MTTPAPKPAASSGGKGMGFLTKKVGPLPVWGWSLIAVGGYYWYTHYGPGAQKAAAAQQQQQKPQVVVINAAGRGKTPRDRGGRPAPPASPKPKPKSPIGRLPRKRKPVESTAQLAAAMPPAPAPPQPAPPLPQAGPPGVDSTQTQSPVYSSWVADENGVPDPAMAYAPMTAGSIYG